MHLTIIPTMTVTTRDVPSHQQSTLRPSPSPHLLLHHGIPPPLHLHPLLLYPNLHLPPSLLLLRHPCPLRLLLLV